MDAESLLEAAVAEGVAYVTGAPFYVDGGGENTMRLTFAERTQRSTKASALGGGAGREPSAVRPARNAGTFTDVAAYVSSCLDPRSCYKRYSIQ